MIKERCKNGGFVYIAYMANLEVDRLTKSAAAKSTSASSAECQVLIRQAKFPGGAEEVAAGSSLFQYCTPHPTMSNIFANDNIRAAVSSAFGSTVAESLSRRMQDLENQHYQVMQDS